MKKFIIVLLVSSLSAFTLACQRDQGVHAGGEGEYQPRPAPANDPANQEVKGELVRVDSGGKRVAVKLENGIVQTFKVEESTQVTGLENDPKSKATGARQLAGKEGSEVTVLWTDDGGSKIANSIEVTQLINSKNTRRSTKR
jgi:hypothetical protein